MSSGGKDYHSTTDQYITAPSPRRQHQPRLSDVGVAFALAVGSYGIVLVAGAVVTLLTGADGWLKAAAVLGIVPLLGVWFGALWEYRKLVQNVERWTGVDIDRDGSVGPPPEPETTHVEWVERTNGGQHIKYLDIPAVFARGVANNEPLSESHWCGDGKPYSVSEFRALRDDLITRGFARWRNERARAQGWELTTKGELMIRHAARIPLPPDA